MSKAMSFIFLIKNIKCLLKNNNWIKKLSDIYKKTIIKCKKNNLYPWKIIIDYIEKMFDTLKKIKIKFDETPILHIIWLSHYWVYF